MIIIPQNLVGFNSKHLFLSITIVANFFLCIWFVRLYYIFYYSNYNGSFWKWSFDHTLFTYAEFFWWLLFYVNGIYLFVVLVEIVNNYLNKKIK